MLPCSTKLPFLLAKKGERQTVVLWQESMLYQLEDAFRSPYFPWYCESLHVVCGWYKILPARNLASYCTLYLKNLPKANRCLSILLGLILPCSRIALWAWGLITLDCLSVVLATQHRPVCQSVVFQWGHHPPTSLSFKPSLAVLCQRTATRSQSQQVMASYVITLFAHISIPLSVQGCMHPSTSTSHLDQLTIDWLQQFQQRHDPFILLMLL